MNTQVSDLFVQSRQFTQSGQLEEAARIYNQILALEPDNPVAHVELGMIALKRGQQELAIDCFSKAIEIDPNQPDSHNILGIALSKAGDLPAGAHCFRQAIELGAGNALVHSNLGSNYKDQGKWVEAVACYRKAISLDPQYLGAYVNLGELLRHHGELDAAAEIYRQALSIDPDLVKIQSGLASTLHDMRNYHEAATIFKKIAANHPDFPGVHNDLGVALMNIGNFGEAIASFKTAIVKTPNFAFAHNNLGGALMAQNELDAGIVCFRKALQIDPNYSRVHSNILLTMNYLSGATQEQIYEEALRYDAQHAKGLLQFQPSFHNSKEKDRVLRIGYVSPDFRSHSVAHFTRALLGAHSRDRVEVFCYANVMKQDQITADFEMQADHWLSIVGLKNEDVADRIRSDQIDILIDLSGHTGNSRLLVFAYKPAPIQVSWLGYPNTTGIACVDYRLTDSVADPQGAADRLHTEKLIRLPQGFLCYQEDDPNPAVSAPPCLERGYVTFGSFNHLPKITSDVVGVWSTILKLIPNSRLVLKSGPLLDENISVKCRNMFVDRGISRDRLDLFGGQPSREEHLGMYSRIDIGLDPFPYNGTTTTCEALWMGVPVICLRGDRHAARVGASIMHHAGLPELVADSRDEYIDLARTFAGDMQRLAKLRNTLRRKMRESVLMDLPLFTETLESAYRKMWIAWCESPERRSV